MVPLFTVVINTTGYGEQSASKYTKGNCIARKDGKSGVGMVGGGAWTKNWLTFDNSYFANYKEPGVVGPGLLWCGVSGGSWGAGEMVDLFFHRGVDSVWMMGGCRSLLRIFLRPAGGDWSKRCTKPWGPDPSFPGGRMSSFIS